MILYVSMQLDSTHLNFETITERYKLLNINLYYLWDF